MNKYDCKKCANYGKGGVFKRNKKCDNCLVDISEHIIVGKPSNFKEKKTNKKVVSIGGKTNV